MKDGPGSTDPLLFQKVPEGLLMVPNNSLQRFAGGIRSAEVCSIDWRVCDMTIVPSLREGNSGHISYSLNCISALF